MLRSYQSRRVGAGPARNKSAIPISWAVLLLPQLIHVLYVLLLPTLSGPLNQFQCWQGVDLAGTALTTVPAVMSPVACATICLKTPGCTSFSLSLSFKCSLMNMPLQSPYGTTGLNANTKTSCLLKTVGGGRGYSEWGQAVWQ